MILALSMLVHRHKFLSPFSIPLYVVTSLFCAFIFNFVFINPHLSLIVSIAQLAHFSYVSFFYPRPLSYIDFKAMRHTSVLS